MFACKLSFQLQTLNVKRIISQAKVAATFRPSLVRHQKTNLNLTLNVIFKSPFELFAKRLY